jgi:hypothetical protein
VRHRKAAAGCFLQERKTLPVAEKPIFGVKPEYAQGHFFRRVNPYKQTRPVEEFRRPYFMMLGDAVPPNFKAVVLWSSDFSSQEHFRHPVFS